MQSEVVSDLSQNRKHYMWLVYFFFGVQLLNYRAKLWSGTVSLPLQQYKLPRKKQLAGESVACSSYPLKMKSSQPYEKLVNELQDI